MPLHCLISPSRFALLRSPPSLPRSVCRGVGALPARAALQPPRHFPAVAASQRAGIPHDCPWFGTTLRPGQALIVTHAACHPLFLSLHVNAFASAFHPQPEPPPGSLARHLVGLSPSLSSLTSPLSLSCSTALTMNTACTPPQMHRGLRQARCIYRRPSHLYFQCMRRECEHICKRAFAFAAHCSRSQPGRAPALDYCARLALLSPFFAPNLLRPLFSMPVKI